MTHEVNDTVLLAWIWVKLDKTAIFRNGQIETLTSGARESCDGSIN